MKKKHKKKKNPPLSKRDKRLYRLGIGAAILLGFVLCLFPFWLLTDLTLSDPENLACFVNATYALWCIGIIMSAIWAICFFENRLIMRIPLKRTKQPELTPRKQAIRQKKQIAAGILSAVILLLCFFGLLRHEVLREDLSLVQYSVLNLPETKAEAADLTGLTISIDRRSAHRRYDEYYYLAITLNYSNGEAERFSSFRPKGEALLRRLLEIKARFPDSAITYKGQDHLLDLFVKQNFSDAERALTYELFGTTPPPYTRVPVQALDSDTLSIKLHLPTLP